MKRPKVIYRFSEHHKLEKHEVLMMLKNCAPQLVDKDRFGLLWFCRCGSEFYGYGKLKEARLERVEFLKREIQENATQLRKLGVRVGLRWVWPDGRETDV